MAGTRRRMKWRFHWLQCCKKSRVGCRLQQTKAVKVAVANGDLLEVNAWCKGLCWTAQGWELTTDFMVMPLGEYGAVLGIQWLSTLGPITWDFQRLTMVKPLRKFSNYWRKTIANLWFCHTIRSNLFGLVRFGPLPFLRPNVYTFCYEDVILSTDGLSSKPTIRDGSHLVSG